MSKLDELKAKSAEFLAHPYAEYVRQLLAEHFGPRMLALAQDDKKMRRSFKFIYRFLPIPARVLIRREQFVNFCMAHKETLLAMYLNSEQKAPEKAD